MGERTEIEVVFWEYSTYHEPCLWRLVHLHKVFVLVENIICVLVVDMELVISIIVIVFHEVI